MTIEGDRVQTEEKLVVESGDHSVQPETARTESQATDEKEPLPGANKIIEDAEEEEEEV